MKPSNLKLSVQSQFLLWYLHENGGCVATTSMPAHWSQQPGMVNMRGLIRRNWVEENHNGIFRITDLGHSAAKLIGPPPKVTTKF